MSSSKAHGECRRNQSAEWDEHQKSRLIDEMTMPL